VCYSAQVWAGYNKYIKVHGAELSIKEFVKLYGFRHADPRVIIPKAMDAAFAAPATDDERAIKALIDEYDAGREVEYTQDLFKQKKRLAEAKRKLEVKPTKKAETDLRVATKKIPQIEGWLADLRRGELQDKDSRIFPGWWAPLMISQVGQRVVVPARYQCRLPGWTPEVEEEYDSFNARRNFITTKGWKRLFGYSHGVMMIDRFYEKVDAGDGKSKTLVFHPNPPHDLMIACLYSFSKGWNGEPDFYSFAAITDDPPPEIAAAGHDRCVIAIKPENLDAWLNPDPANLDALQAILEDKNRPYYEHRQAA